MQPNTPDYALYEKIYKVCEQIPPGMVATYGDIGAIVGGGCDARTVGFALSELPPSHAQLPWQRIINRQGGISTRGLAQRQLLEAEGVAFDANEHVIMVHHRWAGPSAEWATAHGCHTLPARDDAEQLSLF